MTIEDILKTGDRVEFKRYIAEASRRELVEAWIKAGVAKVQDFQTLAFTEINKRRERLLQEVTHDKS